MLVNQNDHAGELDVRARRRPSLSSSVSCVLIVGCKCNLACIALVEYLQKLLFAYVN